MFKSAGFDKTTEIANAMERSFGRLGATCEAETSKSTMLAISWDEGVSKKSGMQEVDAGTMSAVEESGPYGAEKLGRCTAETGKS